MDSPDLFFDSKYGWVRPIISIEFKGKRCVAVGNTALFSEKWKTFTDFLVDYPKFILGSEWGNVELKKAEIERHPLISWYVKTCAWQKRHADQDGLVKGAFPDGVTLAYISFSYDLYTIGHQTRLQELLIKRLKNKIQFQGARFELFAAASCMRAGFEIAFEDESDSTRSHVEFIAKHRGSGELINIEAKSRHRESSDITEKKIDVRKVGIRRLLADAIRKIEAGALPSVIFLELNLPSTVGEQVFDKPWFGDLQRSMDDIIRDKETGEDKVNAIQFVNFPANYSPDTEPALPEETLFVVSLKPKNKKIDSSILFEVYEGSKKHPIIPSRFDECPPIAKYNLKKFISKIGRNDPCLCGSGKKFKRCHGS